MRKQKILIVSAVLLMNVTPAYCGSLLYVDDDASAGGDGQSWDTAFLFLQDALAIASIPEKDITEIRVAQGTYNPDRDEANPEGTADREATFLLVHDVTLKGGYAGIGAEDPDARDIKAFETIFSGDLLGDDGPPGTFKNNEENSYNVLTGPNYLETTTIDGCTIIGGNANGKAYPFNRGGGFRSYEGGLDAFDCKFIGNSAMYEGGAAYIFSICAQFVNCIFEENNAGRGGAIGIHWADSLGASDCVFQNNNAGSGGAIYAIGGKFSINVNLIRCDFYENMALGDSGAIDFWGSNLSMADCNFTNNHAEWGWGGAGAMLSGSIEIIRCTMIGNTAPDAGAFMLYEDTILDSCLFLDNAALGFGGAIYCWSDSIINNSVFVNNTAGMVGGAIAHVSYTNDTLTFINNTVAENKAAWAGGGLHVGELYGSSSGIVDMSNCILWGNQVDGADDEAAQIVASNNGEVIANYSNFQGLTGKLGGLGNIGANPLFADSEIGDFHLSPGSPCIDAGDNLAVLKGTITDLDGNPRFVDDPDTKDSGNGDSPIIDMGAYEFQLVLCPWDLDKNGSVSTSDLLELLSQWGTDGSADFDGSGIVDTIDMLILLAKWGPCE